MRKLAVVLILVSLFTSVNAQKRAIDSLERRISKATSDTQKVNLKYAKLRLLSNGNLDTAIAYGKQLIAEAKTIRYPRIEASARIYTAVDYAFIGNYTAAKSNLDSAQILLLLLRDSLMLGKLYGSYGTVYAKQNKFAVSHAYYQKAADVLGFSNSKDRLDQLSTTYQNNAISYQQESDYANALANYQRALKLSEQTKDEEGMAFLDLNIAITYDALNEYRRSEQSYLKSIELAKKLQLKNVLAYAYANIASLYANNNKFGQQYDFAMKAAGLGKEMADKGIQAASLSRAADALARQNKFDEALKLNTTALSVAAASGEPYNIFQANSGMGFIYKARGLYSQAIPYYEKAFRSLTKSDLYNKEVGTSYSSLSECYEKTGNFSKALSAYKIGARVADSVRGNENIKKSTELRMNYDFEKQQQIVKIEQAKKDADNKRIKHQQYFLIAILGLVVLAVIVIASIQFRNNKHRQRGYDLLQRQKRETDEQRQKTENALSELQLTQSQLIQSAKMASLGDLTAGIAHEIQNPLNFVNNFSDVNIELLEEMEAEIIKGEWNEVKALASDISKNEQKINLHGRRADSIVKGMLEHSRSAGGQKEPTDLNKLSDEYLRLSYHGLRAKDKSFNADLATHFDPSLPKVNAIPQDIGRVMLNLFNNAFYAVNLKQKSAAKDYKPEVSVTTLSVNDQVILKVKDNGAGIPDAIKEKIMQPFFTTKPTGEGTGLGLSLAYDMVVKGHGGNIQVSSAEGEGSEFTIYLPAS